MNIGGGEAADQLVRMLLSGTEVSIRLGGSALKNLLALTMALAKNNKTLSGKVNLGKMLRETRDLRQFSMTPEQYKRFARLAKKQKILFSAIRDRDDRGQESRCCCWRRRYGVRGSHLPCRISQEGLPHRPQTLSACFQSHARSCFQDGKH